MQQPLTSASSPHHVQDDSCMFSELLRLDALRLASLDSIGREASGARERWNSAQQQLHEFEEAAQAAGALLADVLTGRNPMARCQLLAMLQTIDSSIDSIGSPLPAIVESNAVRAVDPELEAPVLLEPDVPTGQKATQDEAPTEPLSRPPVPMEQAPMPLPLSPAVLDALRARLNGVRPKEPAAPPVNHKAHQEALARLRARLGGVPSKLVARSDALNLLRHAEMVMEEPQEWERLTPHGLRLMLEAVAARVRAIQDLATTRPQLGAETQERTHAVMKWLTQRATMTPLDRAAFGLAKKHEPKTGSWLEDAKQTQVETDDLLGRQPTKAEPAALNPDEGFRRLRSDVDNLQPAELVARVEELLACGVAEDDKRFVKLLDPRCADLSGSAAVARVARAVVEARGSQTDEPLPVTSPLPTAWWGKQYTAGKRAVIVGGDGRETRAPLLQSAFGFASLDWPDIPKNSPRRVDTLVRQLRNGKYDFVICLQRFISHSVTDTLFGLAVPGVTVVLAEGYGVQQIRAGLERYLPRPE